MDLDGFGWSLGIKINNKKDTKGYPEILRTNRNFKKIHRILKGPTVDILNKIEGWTNPVDMAARRGPDSKFFGVNYFWDIFQFLKPILLITILLELSFEQFFTIFISNFESFVKDQNLSFPKLTHIY